MEHRYLKNLEALSPEDQKVLTARRVLVAGCGGLGGYVLEHLARVGVGHLTIVDGDIFETTNLNRQRFSDSDSLGRSKTQVVKERLASINPEVVVAARHLILTERNAPELLDGCDLVVDALDNTPSRLALSRAAARLGLTLVHGAVAGWQGHVAVISPGTPLLDRLYRDRASTGTPGNLSFTCGAVAAMQAALAVMLLLDRNVPHRDRLLTLDLAAGTWDTLMV